MNFLVLSTMTPDMMAPNGREFMSNNETRAMKIKSAHSEENAINTNSKNKYDILYA